MCYLSVFPYNQGAEDLAEVSEDDYVTCNGKNPINHWKSGNTSVTLQSAGTRFFISSFPGHCPPLKLAVTVIGPINYTDSSISATTATATLHSVPTSNHDDTTHNVKNDASSMIHVFSNWVLFGTITTLVSFSLV